MSISMRRDRRGTFANALILGPVLSIVFLAVVAKAALLTERFVHANFRPRAMRHLALPFVCTITATAGLAAPLAFGAGAVSIVISSLAGIVTSRVLRLHFPPALTVGLLPQIMPHADWRFVLAVALGTTTLTAAVLLARPFLLNQSTTLTAG
jgi:hypothetical protein